MSVGSEMIFTRLESGRAGMDEDRKDLDDQELTPVFHEYTRKFDTPKGRKQRDVAIFLILVPLGVILPSDRIQMVSAVVFIIFMIRNWSFSIPKKKLKVRPLPENVILFRPKNDRWDG